jgi:hypothetical protein
MMKTNQAKGKRQRRVLELPASVAKQWTLLGRVAAVNEANHGLIHGRDQSQGSTKVKSSNNNEALSIPRTGTRSDKARAFTPPFAEGAASDSSESPASARPSVVVGWSCSLFRYPRPAGQFRAKADGSDANSPKQSRRRRNSSNTQRSLMSSSSLSSNGRPPLTDPPASSSACMWKTAVDPASGRNYYYHVETRQTQWRKPLELATAEERKALLEKDAQQRAFFQAMEANILKGLATPKTSSANEEIKIESQLMTKKDEPESNHQTQTPAIPRPMGMRVRTISTMDVTVLKDLIGSLPSNSSAAVKKMHGSSSRSNIRSDSTGSVASLGVRSSLLSIIEDHTDAEDLSEELHKSEAVVQDFFQSLQEQSDVLVSNQDDEKSSHSSSSSPLHQDDSQGNAQQQQEQLHQSESEFSVDSEADMVKNKYMTTEPRPRRPHALSKDDSVAGSSTSSTSLSIGALGISDRQLSSRSMESDASGILSEGGLSILDDEEVLALRQLATAANQMLHLADEEESDKSEDDSLEGLQISSNHAPQPQTLLRELSSLTDDGDKEASAPCVSLPPLPRPASLATSPPKSFPARPNMLQHRRNTCGTIYVSSTLSDPDKDATIMCVCAVYRTHVLQSTMEDAIVSEDYAIFNDLVVLQRRGSRVEFQNELVTDVPTLEEVSSFYRAVFRRAKMESDCIIMSLIYVERLIKKTNGLLRPRPENWRSILFACMVLSSKVWDDMSMWNADFSHTCPAGIRFPLQRINELEVAVLSSLEYKVKVKAGEYAKYYFLLRTMLIKSGLGGHDLETMLPLDVEGAKRLQQVSSQFQTTRAFTHQYRSKSMGTLTSSSPRISDAKAFPKAGLEQLVKM